MKKLLAFVIVVGAVATLRADWNQFRGPAGRGVADDAASLPADIGPDSPHLAWKSPVPKGHSTPVVHGDRIFMTGLAEKSLRTFAVNRLDLFCYDVDGKQLWHRPMGPFNNSFGAASSPLLIDDRIVMVQDHDTGSFLAVYDKNSGDEVWKAERPNSRRNYSTPCIWTVDGKRQIVVAGSALVDAYDYETGDLIWTVRGVSRVVNT